MRRSPSARPKTAAHGRTLLRSEGFLAPGPPTDCLVQRKVEPKGISKEQLIQLAQESNLRNGRDANQGLEAFLPKPVLPPRNFAIARDITKKRGFRAVAASAVPKKRSFAVLDPSSSAVPLPEGKLLPATTTNAERHSFAALIQAMQASVPALAERMNKRMILSRQANEIRAETIVAARILEREKRLLAAAAKVSKESSQQVSHTQEHTPSCSHKSLATALESRIVDKLAAAEIEAIKLVESAYPKISNEQIQMKLTKLKMNAQANFKPLEEVRYMDVIYLKNKRI